MTFSEVVEEVLHFAGQGSGGEFENHVKVLVNEKYQYVLSSAEVPNEPREFTLTSVASTSQYGMPLYVKEVLNVEDPTTPRFVYVLNRRLFDLSYPGTTDSGTPLFCYPLNVRGVQRHPSTDCVLTLVSDSTADAGSSFKVRVTGFNSSGVLVTELVTMNGTSEVSTSNTYDSTLGVERLVKAPSTGKSFTGNVTVSDAADNVLATIPTWWDSPEYAWIEFHPIPAAAINYNIRAEMRRPPLVNDEDWPELPEAFHMMLVFGVTQDLLGKQGMAAVANQHRATYKEMETRLKREMNKSVAGVHSFADVQSATGLRNRPHRPLIKGVDYGLAE